MRPGVDRDAQGTDRPRVPRPTRDVDFLGYGDASPQASPRHSARCAERVSHRRGLAGLVDQALGIEGIFHGNTILLSLRPPASFNVC